MGFYYNLFRSTLRRQSLQRFLQNIRLEQLYLQGEGIDLGGYPDSQYHQLITKSKDVKIQCSDLHCPSPDMLEIDLEKKFPIDGNSQDFLLLMNVTEHLFDVYMCLSESGRVLKQGGRLLMMSPFLFPVHLVPDDFNRLTESSLRRMLKKSGFSTVNVEAIGRGRWTAAASLIGQKIKFKPIAFSFYIIAMKLDDWFPEGNYEKNGLSKYPLCYFVEAIK